MEEPLPDDNPLMYAKQAILSLFPENGGSTQSIEVSLIWGVDGLDKSNVGSWDTDDLGQLKWDAQFTIYPPQNQLSLLKLCNWLENESELVQNGIVDCWIKQFDQFLKKDSENEIELPLDD